VQSTSRRIQEAFTHGQWDYRRIYDEFILNSKYKLTGNYEYQKYGEDGSIEICIPVTDL
jgi:hypothetical protein